MPQAPRQTGLVAASFVPTNPGIIALAHGSLSNNGDRGTEIISPTSSHLIHPKPRRCIYLAQNGLTFAFHDLLSLCAPFAGLYPVLPFSARQAAKMLTWFLE